ncbi:MAG TPA: glycerol-3-phosphate dehydrogenase [Casimicrobiaceae bacterium]|nr:glycerol-3-phosphate dehydrogenase [Casimicrobiaceae bacterium]
MDVPTYDLLVIGGGINGAGIARDAIGRGMSVLLVERGDIASATSQWSTKLIHGGLRYLEHYEFRLVSESLAEREVLLRLAPHLVEPLSFVLPHEPHLRPAWMIRAGLFLYDHIGGRRTLPGSFGVRLDGTPWGAGLKPQFKRGFVYADARVDDARLVLVNAMDARDRGAQIRVRTRLTHAQRQGGMWRATLTASHGATQYVDARAIVNAAGPWVKDVLGSIEVPPIEADVRHVKGSHIVVPRVHDQPHAYLLQNADNRIVFVIPYQERYSLIGTTDVPVQSYEAPRIDPGEIEYLINLANNYLARPLKRNQVVWTYSGVRPLYDDGSADASAITRDYVVKLDALPGTSGPGRAPLISIFGGKLTTYRKLAEDVLAQLGPFFPDMGTPWTARDCLPGGDLPRGDRAAFAAELVAKYSGVAAPTVRAIASRHGTRATVILDGARAASDLGRDFGATLTEREIDYCVREEWAQTGEDVLWRRTKAGLAMTAAQRKAVDDHLAGRRVTA